MNNSSASSRRSTDYRDFQELRDEGYTHAPLVREILVDLDTPLSAYIKLTSGHDDSICSFLFESVQGGERWGRYSIIGPGTSHGISLRDGVIREFDGETLVSESPSDDPLEAIRAFAARYKVPDIEGLPRFTGGLVGYFGAELIRYVEPQLKRAFRDAELDDIRLVLADELVIFDNLRGSAFLVVHADLSRDDAEAEAIARLDALEARLREPLPAEQPAGGVKGEFVSSFGQDAFKESVETVREYIRNGDAMQVVLSQRLESDFNGKPLDVYRALRAINPSPYLYFLDFGDVQVAGSSPEVLVRVEDGELTVRPIAGTRPRGGNVEEDRRLEAELHADPKELAEHLMLIDLGRNDVGRVAEVGSVELTEKMVTERYSHVMHIVSNVKGRLKDGLDALDALASTFPAGTLSGAPKLRALEIIDELEPVPRGIYSGAIGYLGWQGNLDTAIAIRTAVIRDGKLQVQAGAGIVYDSDPQAEWDETMNKSRALLEAVKLAGKGLDRIRFGEGGK
ncbi:MAG: anthranilate synthase component I [Gammaproteobacteria bacterium]|nr:anthranilate synthase component I [Gammaproteobacteria bacterium]